jgi:hypothetical protein
MSTVLGEPETVTIEGGHAWLIADPDTFGEVMTNVVGIVERAQALPPLHPIRKLGLRVLGRE